MLHNVLRSVAVLKIALEKYEDVNYLYLNTVLKIKCGHISLAENPCVSKSSSQSKLTSLSCSLTQNVSDSHFRSKFLLAIMFIRCRRYPMKPHHTKVRMEPFIAFNKA